MSSTQKQMGMLVVLVMLWSGLAAWLWFTTQQPLRMPLANVTGTASAVQKSSRMASNPFHVQLELLAAVRTQRDLAFVVPRNIFSLTSTPSAALSDQQGEGDPLQAGAQADTELSQYQYLGFVRTGEEWDKTRDLAVVTRNEDLHLVRKGQVVESRIVVKQITPESITLQDRRSRQEHTVPLSEEELSDP